MKHYLVKSYSVAVMGFVGLLVEANSKEEAKEIVRTTTYKCGGANKAEIEIDFIVYGAKEVAVDDRGYKFEIKPEGRTHAKEVAENRTPEVKNFLVKFIANKDGLVKSTTVKATNGREAKKLVKEFGTPISAEISKGRNKKVEAPKSPVRNGSHKVENGLDVYLVSKTQLIKMVKDTSGWPSYYIETAGGSQSGMSRF